MGDIATVTVEFDEEQMDVLITGIRELHERIDALERRIADIERKLSHKTREDA